MTKETSFSHAFKTEAIILVKIGLPSFKLEEYNEGTNSEWLRANLDLLEEHRECAIMPMAFYH